MRFMLNEMATLKPQPVLRTTRLSVVGCLLLVLFVALAGCGGSSSGGSAGAAGYKLHSGLAEKGPFITGGTVTVQELDQNLSPAGDQHISKVSTDVGTFVTKDSLNSRFVSVSVDGYFFDELRNETSTEPLTLSAYGDLESSPSVNVNLLTTLAYARIYYLVVQSGVDFQSARVRAQKEVLAAFHLRALSSDFNQLELQRQRDPDYILLAISSIFLQASLSDNLTQLIADFQNDIADNGVIDNTVLAQALTDASKSVDPYVVAANITAEYKSLITLQNNFRGQDIAQWLDQDGSGIVGKYKFLTENADPSSINKSPPYVAGPDDDLGIVSSSAGTLMINGSAAPNGKVVHDGDEITLSLISGALPNDAVSGQIMINATPVARFTVVTAPIPISAAAIIQSIGVPSKLAVSPDDSKLYIASMPGTKIGSLVDNGGLHVFDVTDISSPGELQLVQFPSGGLLTGYYGVSISPDGNTAYVASSQQEMQLIDLTYLNTPALIARIATDGLAMSIVDSQGLSSVFVGTSGYQVQEFDISSPGNPLLSHSVTTDFQPWAVAISPDDTQVVALSTKGPGTDLIDVATSAKVASSNATSAVFCGNQILLAVGASGDQLTFEVIDVSNPAAPVSLGLGTATLSSAYDGSGIGVSFEQNTNMAYVVAQGEVFLIDLSDLTKPMMRGSMVLSTMNTASGPYLSPTIVSSSDGKSLYVSWQTAVYALKVGN